ncbi:hypothetical protein SMMN14_06331 [Sphaerulina musiva]
MDPIDEECLSGYRPSSYYPVKPGDIINQSYAVKVQLGFGRSSTTWFCTDQDQKFKALKISTASDRKMEDRQDGSECQSRGSSPIFCYHSLLLLLLLLLLHVRHAAVLRLCQIYAELESG